MLLDPDRCRVARLSRDVRFDGRFFVGVTTTGIYCRPICPARPPRDDNVRYFPSAVSAAQAGFRPCLRCRPDSAPESPAWHGNHTTLRRALRLIDEGALSQASLGALCDRLGIGERYLRLLFKQHLGVSPKAYALHRQCLFAKQLLHQSALPVADIAYASGFTSLRRFNDAFRRQVGHAPRELRRTPRPPSENLTLTLAYRPPYAWEWLRDFLAVRRIDKLEWGDAHRYGRYIQWGSARGHFTAEHMPDQHCFRVTLNLDDLGALSPVVRNIRRVLDLDADTALIEAQLQKTLPETFPLVEGLRLPGLWSPFEAGIRAVLGQQVSISAARGHTTNLVEALGEPTAEGGRHFPTAAQVADSDLTFLRMPQARRDCLRGLAHAACEQCLDDDPRCWTALKGIGPWSADYAALRGTSHPDIWLGGDLGVKRALTSLDAIEPDLAAPWRSYLTLQLWSR
ncbi:MULTISPECIES: DNA-3-methyladenine glycosylase 2 family protein [Chromohalobacter]|uniref:DNA-3-methyladenine glycosylase 2 family protein n=1 Tax=Chromohalobacter TaxID=42054 RepID=UPI00300E534C